MKQNERSAVLSKAAGAGVMIVLSGLLAAGSGPLYKAVAGRNREVSETPVYYAGTYEGTSRGYGGPVTVRLTVSDYAIEDVRISAPEETPEIGKAVAVQLSNEMWRANSFSVDSVSGATMTSNAVKKAVGQCLEQAAREGTEAAKLFEAEFRSEKEARGLPELSEILPSVPDGDYIYRDTADDGSGHFNEIRVTVEKGTLTALSWDAVAMDGSGKREQSLRGQYVMTENGPLWHEQADTLAQYVVENQSTEGVVEGAGVTDALASVSIYPGGFVDAVKKCLMAASGDLSFASLEELLAGAEDGSYSYTSPKKDDSGMSDRIDLTVKDHAIAALVWDSVGEDGTGKRQLSMDGQYQMTEDGPLWYEQADTLAKYVLENQSVEGLSDSEGYATDAVSSVSINISGFINALKGCLSQGNRVS